jgi:hypothetical protein
MSRITNCLASSPRTGRELFQVADGFIVAGKEGFEFHESFRVAEERMVALDHPCWPCKFAEKTPNMCDICSLRELGFTPEWGEL